MLPVSVQGFRGRFEAGFCQKATAKAPESGTKLREPPAPAIWDRIWVRLHLPSGRNQPKTSPGNSARGPEALLSNLKSAVCGSGLARSPFVFSSGRM